MQCPDLGSLQPPPPCSRYSAASASLVAGTPGTCHQAGIIFVFLVQTGFRHVGHAGLEILPSGDTPISQSAGITGMSHGAWPLHSIFKLGYLFSYCLVMNYLYIQDISPY